MRSPTACGLLTAALCGLLTAVRCERDVHGLLSAAPETIRDVMRAVSARDGQWRDVLTRRVRLDRSRLDVYTVDELLETWRPAATVQRVVARLATDPAATNSELRYGAFALGAALSCSFLDTLLLHAFYTSVLGRRGRADAATLERCLSAVRAALAVYVDKLVAFGQDVQPFVEFNRTVNKALLALRRDVKTFAEDVDRLMERAGAALTERCGGPGVVQTVEVVEIGSDDDDDDGKTDGRTEVGDDRLADMVQDVDGYEYVSLQSYGPDRWTTWLNGGKAFDGTQDDRVPNGNPEDGPPKRS